MTGLQSAIEIPAKRLTHTCPIGVVPASSSDDPIVDENWCFDAWAERVEGLPATFPEDAYPPRDWILFESDTIEVAYAPFDLVNPRAEVVLVGITPGRFQAWTATIEAGRALRSGASVAEAMLRGSQRGGFGGPMRKNLVSMLDGIGIQRALGIETCNSFFGDDHHLCDTKSAIDYPVFINGKSYTGSNPDIAKSPCLSSLVRQTLGGALHLAADALVIPLGATATQAVEALIAGDLLKRERCLIGVPHPSSAYPQRFDVFRDRQVGLSKTVAEWSGAAH